MARKQMQYSCIYKHTMTIPSNGKKFPISKMRKTGRREKLRKLSINAMDSKEIMNLEKGFEINPCWNEFNPTPETLLRKKEIVNPSFPVHAFFKICIFKMAVREVVSVSRVFERLLMKTPL